MPVSPRVPSRALAVTITLVFCIGEKSLEVAEGILLSLNVSYILPLT